MRTQMEKAVLFRALHERPGEMVPIKDLRDAFAAVQG
jgi:hypothetical protein